MIGGCHDHGVDVVPLQKLAVVLVLLHFGAGDFLLQVGDSFAAAHIPGIANGDKLGATRQLRHAHQVLAASATTDGTDANTIVRTQDSGGSGGG